MVRRGLILTFVLLTAITVFANDIGTSEPPPFPIFPETTRLGEFMCDLWFWRGEPPCLNTTAMHGSYIRYPTRQKARIIVDSYYEQGLYSREILTAYFGTLMVGTYRPEYAASVGRFWDSAYWALVRLDYPLEARDILWDIVFQRNWAEGKFADERYQALEILSKERLITLREYDRLKGYLEEELESESLHIAWTNALVTALSSFREWNEELLPLYRKVFKRMEPGKFRPLLEAFIDFDIPDDGIFIIDRVMDGTVEHLKDRKLSIRAAYVLDDEYALMRLKELKGILEKIEEPEEDDKEYLAFVQNSIARLEWFGRWEITGTRLTVDDGLTGESILFRMSNSLDDSKDIVDFSMPMQITDPEELLPIGTDLTYLTNYVSFHITPETLILRKEIPRERTFVEKVFTIREGTGRDAGKIFLRFPIEGEYDQRGDQRYGWIEVEKVS